MALATAPRPPMVDVAEYASRIMQSCRQQHACSCGECIETALGPRKLTPGGSYSYGFAASLSFNRLMNLGAGARVQPFSEMLASC